jgi:hypothetical protein
MSACKRSTSKENLGGEGESPGGSERIFTPAQAQKSFSLAWIDTFHVIGAFVVFH